MMTHPILNRWLIAVAAISWMLLLASWQAHARWKPEYANADPAVAAWYESRILTEAAEKRFGFHSCCAHADTVKTKFRISRGSAGPQWWWLNAGQWTQVPPDIIHWNQHSPSNEPVLFAVGGAPVCFFPPGAGI